MTDHVIVQQNPNGVQVVQPVPPPSVQEVKKVEGIEMGMAFGIMVLIFGIINLAFIIPDLIYAYQDSACVLTYVDGFSFNLKTWLQVDGYTRLGMIVLLLIVAVVSCISVDAGARLGICVVVTMILYSLFAFAWIIVGSVLFWNKLNPQGICRNGVHDYMYALLIISYVAIFLTCLSNIGLGKKHAHF